MPAANVSPQTYTVPKGEIRKMALAFSDILATDEALTGTPTVAASSSGVTTSAVAINTTGTLVVLGTTHSANTVVTWTANFTAATTGEAYGLLVTAGSSVSTFKRVVFADVIKASTWST